MATKKQLEPVAPAADKKKALAAALSQIEKQFGKGSVMCLGENTGMTVEHIPTGSIGLDLALGIGGLPRGRIIEIYGPESSGKTTVALHSVAEAQKLCDISTGASNDLQRATGIARDMVAKYGMSDSIGPVSYAGGQEVFIGRDYEKTKPYSEQTAGQIDAQVQKIMREAYQRCEQILRDHAERLDKIAGFLMENENMSRAQFEAVMQDETLDQPKA